MLTAAEAAELLCDRAGHDLEERELHALLYYAQGCHLALHGVPLFDGPIVATAEGVVVPAICDQR